MSAVNNSTVVTFVYIACTLCQYP